MIYVILINLAVTIAVRTHGIEIEEVANFEGVSLCIFKIQQNFQLAFMVAALKVINWLCLSLLRMITYLSFHRD